VRRPLANRLKLAGLSFIYAGSIFALDKLGVHDLASPWLCTALIPLILIYIGERLGSIGMFRGISLPSLLLWSSSNLEVWVLNTRSDVPEWAGYLILGLFLAALTFALLRVWTYQERPLQLHPLKKPHFG
jgi:hypothetical protein